MSEVLARIRVRETHGIRRFLYPLIATIYIPMEIDLDVIKAFNDKTYKDKTYEELYGNVCLQDLSGQGIPCQFVDLTKLAKLPETRLDFALSLAPGETKEVVVLREANSAVVPDPLRLANNINDGDEGLKNTQERFGITIAPEGTVGEVIYDGIRHLRGPSQILRNGKSAWFSSATSLPGGNASLAAWLSANSRYDDGGFAQTRVELTACKSWATITHTLEQPKPGDEIVFTLPLAITSPTLICDFGVGGYVFGKLDEKASEIVWCTKFGGIAYAKWTVATAGRVDYVGEVATAQEFQSQRWFHLIDSDKALAVAITVLPNDCREMTVRITHTGEVTIAFKMGDTVAGHADFGVCYHFLNDVPAIAAATNPQSILLPPVVEVLPAQFWGARQE